jgi:hypothetical protein
LYTVQNRKNTTLSSFFDQYIFLAAKRTAFRRIGTETQQVNLLSKVPTASILPGNSIGKLPILLGEAQIRHRFARYQAQWIALLAARWTPAKLSYRPHFRYHMQPAAGRKVALRR